MQNTMLSIAVSDDQKFAISCASDNNLIRYMLGNDTQGVPETVKQSLKANGIAEVQIRDDLKIVVLAGWDGKIRIFSFKTLKPLAILTCHRESLYCVALASVEGVLQDLEYVWIPSIKDTSNDEGNNHNDNDTNSDSDSSDSDDSEEDVEDQKRRLQEFSRQHWLAAGGKENRISQSQHTAGQRLTTYGSKNKPKKESNAPHPVLGHWERLDLARIRKRQERRDGSSESDGNASALTILPMRHEDEDSDNNYHSDNSKGRSDHGSSSSAGAPLYQQFISATDRGKVPVGQGTDRAVSSSATSTTEKHVRTNSLSASASRVGGGCTKAVHRHDAQAHRTDPTNTIVSSAPHVTKPASHHRNGALFQAENQDIFQEITNDLDHDMIERFDEEFDDLDGDDVEEDDEVLFRTPSQDMLQKIRNMRPSLSTNSPSPSTHISSQQSRSTATPLCQSQSQRTAIKKPSSTRAPFLTSYKSKADEKPASGSVLAIDERAQHRRDTKFAAGPGADAEDAMATTNMDSVTAVSKRRQRSRLIATSSSTSSPSLPSSSSSSSLPLLPVPGRKTLKHDANNPFLDCGPANLPSKDKKGQKIASEAPNGDDSPEVALGKRMSTIEITPKRLLAKQRKMAASKAQELNIDDDDDDEGERNMVASSAKSFAPASPLASFFSANRHRDAMARVPGSPLAARARGVAVRDFVRPIPTVARPTLQDLVAVCDQWLCVGTSSPSSSTTATTTTARVGRSRGEREPSSLAIADLPTFEQFVLENPALQTSLCKVGEASYSEVYTAMMPDISNPLSRPKASVDRKKPIPVDGHGDPMQGEDEDWSRDKVVLKVVPFLNQTQRNGPRGTTMTVLSDIYREVVMSTRVVRGWDGFMSSIGAIVVRGKYPKCFLAAWDKYKLENGTESARPGRYSSNQLYCILLMPFGGIDLEHYTLLDWRQAWTILTQLTLLLATREQEPFLFEHRDLHWGNILVTQTSEASIHLDSKSTFSYMKQVFGSTVKVPTFGIRAQIIDYTLARVNTGPGKQVLYMDLEDDQELFEGKGDLQFDVYRSMQQETNKDWAGSYPRTNILWLHYLCKKLVEDKGLVKPKRRLKLMTRHKDGDETPNNPLLHKDEHWFYDRVLRVSQLLKKDSSRSGQDPVDPGRELPSTRIQTARQLLHSLLA
ncbi:hypothetical protein BGZ73_008409 [Actinomortierella ambigua]|nr:hypothetical protein BGZ73_008409 [Actinomortierella ambigua]